VRYLFDVPERMTYESLRRFKDRTSISYSRLVNILADGALPILAGRGQSKKMYEIKINHLTDHQR
jgi:hypothetical protein